MSNDVRWGNETRYAVPSREAGPLVRIEPGDYEGTVRNLRDAAQMVLDGQSDYMSAKDILTICELALDAPRSGPLRKLVATRRRGP